MAHSRVKFIAAGTYGTDSVTILGVALLLAKM